MASEPHLDELRNSLNNLPEELQRNFSLMQELDLRSQKVMNNIDNIANNYLSNAKEYSLDEKKVTMANITHQFNIAKEYSDDKVQLSIESYELVDKYIQKLDTELLKFNGKIKLQTDVAIKAKMNLPPKKEGSKTTSAPPSVSAVTVRSKPTNSVDDVAVETGCFSGASVGDGISHSAYVDMPIDPNEPTFCLCKQVSFGEMIGCDNPDCAIEWFHFACLCLNTKPKGKWFCPNCVKDKKKK
ncbi:unnamed protein product [Macrosiphum euphorbiae]|uniref:Inhibitor of growth protein n=1 Tax=Macrosiphum euphorbiae TaxID=13131 RepID=A0AAV0WFG7_9HEMI|nr:unnamed protein product [Macrosiphum euphorbiae]